MIETWLNMYRSTSFQFVSASYKKEKDGHKSFSIKCKVGSFHLLCGVPYHEDIYTGIV